MRKQNIDYTVIVVEQNDNNPFNRGLLCNVGFDYTKNNSIYTCFHDVDVLGEDFNYRSVNTVTHLSCQYKMPDGSYKKWYERSLGGVTIFPNTIFSTINGFNNSYWGWGCEDDDLRIRCYTYNIHINQSDGKYISLPHPKNMNRELYDTNFKNLIYHHRLQKKDRIEKFKENGLSTTSNFIEETQIIDKNQYTLLKVKTIYDKI